MTRPSESKTAHGPSARDQGDPPVCRDRHALAKAVAQLVSALFAQRSDVATPRFVCLHTSHRGEAGVGQRRFVRPASGAIPARCACVPGSITLVEDRTAVRDRVLRSPAHTGALVPCPVPHRDRDRGAKVRRNASKDDSDIGQSRDYFNRAANPSLVELSLDHFDQLDRWCADLLPSGDAPSATMSEDGIRVRWVSRAS